MGNRKNDPPKGERTKEEWKEFIEDLNKVIDKRPRDDKK